ncbi:hypothetical protein QO010_002938 [Caulobacter ginsengisoli]|uniref:Nickel transporter n=1 Tax=Caulobacter ginsengisoli TaxID=400775 RepID=A0ABU0IT43_9CAUL|nr:hypothetical protein [Caulobacter ginsengisoli]MDQ0465154.1 hypothetical protein [Caulobacter ginsengisoli]
MRRLALAAALGLLASTALAHETWLRASAPAQVGQPLALGLTSGADFPKPDAGPKPDRIDRLSLAIDGQVQPIEVTGPGGGELRLSFTPQRAGLAVVAVSLKPRPITLDPAEVPEYLAEADPGPEVISAWAMLKPKGDWREVYVKNAKLLVCVAPCEGSRAAMAPSGQDLEFVALEPGPSPRRLNLLQGGQPAVNRTVWLHQPGAAPRKLTTSPGGEIVLPAGLTGEVMLSSIWLRPPVSMMMSGPGGYKPGDEGVFASDFASIVFQAGS